MRDPIFFKKGQNKQISQHFESSEFECPCIVCVDNKIEQDLIDMLERVRASLQCPIQIHKGGAFRCDEYQNDLARRGYETAAHISQHQLGAAADIGTGLHSGLELELHARNAGFMAVGVAQSWIHVDLRSDKKRLWEYKKR